MSAPSTSESHTRKATMMSIEITPARILSDALENLVYQFDAGYLSESSYADNIRECIDGAIDSALVYTYDIRQAWEAIGHPEPEEMHGSIIDSITCALAEALAERVQVGDVVDAFLTHHADHAALTGMSGEDDPHGAMCALIDWRDNQ